MPAMTCEQTAWITFPAEVFVRKTLCSIVLDLCTQRTQTQTDTARVLFPRAAKHPANVSCLLHCRYDDEKTRRRHPENSELTEFLPRGSDSDFVIRVEETRQHDTLFTSDQLTRSVERRRLTTPRVLAGSR